MVKKLKFNIINTKTNIKKGKNFLKKVYIRKLYKSANLISINWFTQKRCLAKIKKHWRNKVIQFWKDI